MPSKLGFGNTRKKSSPALYGSAEHYKNPIQKKMETLPGIDTKLDAKSPVRKNGGTSEKIGPEISPKMMSDLVKKRDDAEMNLNVSSDQAFKEGAKVQEKIDEERKYVKGGAKKL